MNFLVGADPEVFVKQQGIHASGYGLVPGTKAEPYPVRNGAVQVDGMALEFNINPVATADEFVFNVQSVLAQLSEMVPEYEVVADPVARFTAEFIQSQPDEATELGCDPDYNAWSDTENVKPDCNLPMRTGAGHVHIGWTEDESANDPEHRAMCLALVKQLDFFLGLPSLVYDKEVDRRAMYGQAGAFRPKPYGVEYRVLSNAWLRDEGLMRWVFQNVEQAMACMDAPLEEKYGDIQTIINTSDVDAALVIIQAEGIPMPEVS